jgi:hydrogenase-4 component E
MISEYSLVYLLSALTMVSSFYLQGQTFIRPMISGVAVQSALMSSIVFLLAYFTHSLDLVILGLLLIFLRGILVSYQLESKIRERSPSLRELSSGLASTFLIVLLFIIIGITAIYFDVFSKIVTNVEIGSSSILLFPFALFFMGLFLILSRKGTFAQIIGYVEEENAMILMAIFLLPVPIVIDASVILDVFALVVISSVIAVEKDNHSPMEELKG